MLVETNDAVALSGSELFFHRIPEIYIMQNTMVGVGGGDKNADLGGKLTKN